MPPEKSKNYTPTTLQRRKNLKRRYLAEALFRKLGVLSVAIALFFLLFLFGTIIRQGYSAFIQTSIHLQVALPKSAFIQENIAAANYKDLLRQALYRELSDITSPWEQKSLDRLISPSAIYILQDTVAQDPALIGETVDLRIPADDDVDMYVKGKLKTTLPGAVRRLTEKDIERIDLLKERGSLRKRFNTDFFLFGDSREPEAAGILGAVKGSFYTLLITLCFSFPIGVATAIYLEEFAPDNRLTNIIEVNINNLAAVPSIIFGLLGLAVFINIFGMPRSTPLVGGLVLTLMTLPTIIITARAALQGVPGDIREAAYALGASKMQTVLHHVLPLAMPGMLTGTILGMAQALGETAPLLMIGMVAFIADIPSGVLNPATALPVQIFLWADSPEKAFTERTAAAIIILLLFLIVMNAAAVILRKRFETRL